MKFHDQPALGGIGDVAPLAGSVEGGIILSKRCFNYAPSEYKDIDRDGYSYTRSAYVNLCRREKEDRQPLDSLRERLIRIPKQRQNQAQTAALQGKASRRALFSICG